MLCVLRTVARGLLCVPPSRGSVRSAADPREHPQARAQSSNSAPNSPRVPCRPSCSHMPLCGRRWLLMRRGHRRRPRARCRRAHRRAHRHRRPLRRPPRPPSMVRAACQQSNPSARERPVSPAAAAGIASAPDQPRPHATRCSRSPTRAAHACAGDVGAVGELPTSTSPRPLDGAAAGADALRMRRSPAAARACRPPAMAAARVATWVACAERAGQRREPARWPGGCRARAVRVWPYRRLLDFFREVAHDRDCITVSGRWGVAVGCGCGLWV